MYKENSLFFAADSDAPYSHHTTIDLSEVQSYIALYPNPDDVQPVSMHLGMEFDGIFIGACTTTEEDLVLAGLILRAGLARGLPLSAGRRIVVPGSLPIVCNLRKLGLVDVFARSGYEQPAPSCSLCLGIGADVAPSGTKWLTTQNRNFENRMGKGKYRPQCCRLRLVTDEKGPCRSHWILVLCCCSGSLFFFHGFDRSFGVAGRHFLRRISRLPNADILIQT